MPAAPVFVRYLDLSALSGPITPPSSVAEHVQHYTHASDRLRSAAVWRLLQKLVEELSPGLPFSPRFLPSGKPVLEGIYISLSHSGNLVCAAASSQPVGVDVEQMKPRNLDSLARRCLSVGEFRRYQQAEDSLSFFYQHWTAKEACAKLTGAGLVGFGAELELLEDGTICSFPARHRLLHDAAQAPYWLCAVGGEPCMITKTTTFFPEVTDETC